MHNLLDTIRKQNNHENNRTEVSVKDKEESTSKEKKARSPILQKHKEAGGQNGSLKKWFYFENY